MELQTNQLAKMIIADVDETIIDFIQAPQKGVVKIKEDILLIDVGSGISIVTVYNIEGKQVYSKSLDVGLHGFPLSTLPKGILIIKVEGETIKIKNQ